MAQGNRKTAMYGRVDCPLHNSGGAIHIVIYANCNPCSCQWTAWINICGHSEASGPAKPIAGGHMEMPGTQLGSD